MTPKLPASSLSQTRENLGPAPRKFGKRLLRSYLICKPPSWARHGEETRYWENNRQLLENGTVVLAHIVQANTYLYEHGEFDCPGVVVYCGDPRSTITAEDLKQMAHEIHRLRKSQPEDPTEKQIGSDLRNEKVLFFGQPVPTSISPQHQCQISSILFNRQHFPTGILARQSFPVLLSKEARGSVIMVPSRYWPKDVVTDWKRAAAESSPGPSFAKRGSRYIFGLLFGKIILLLLCAIYILATIPRTIQFLGQSKPFPIQDIQQLESLPNHTIVRVSTNLETNITLKTSRHFSYTPLAGTQNKIWYRHNSLKKDEKSALSDAICIIQKAGWSEQSLKNEINAAGIPHSWPVSFLSSTKPPTLGMKIWRVSLIVIAALILLLAYRMTIRWWNEP